MSESHYFWVNIIDILATNMLSICIPIYNQDVNKLVSALGAQVDKLSTPAEIILIDDCSAREYKLTNEVICQKHKYVQLEENIGRSKIRNRFLQYVNYDYLLFLDCDGIIVSSQFLNNYIEILIKENPQVVCGGRIYPPEQKDRKHRLSWRYGTIKESRIALKRSKGSFISNNFVVRRTTFKAISFDEKLLKYGHEDTLFGYELKREGVKILHIDNNVLNGDIEDNICFLEKTTNGIENLVYILNLNNNDIGLIREVKLLKHYFLFKKYGVMLIVDIIFALSKQTIGKLLKSGYANLFLFDIYKLGTLSKAIKSNS